MQNIDELIKLTEQAASAVTMLSPEDLSEITNLQDVLGNIRKVLSDSGIGPAEILEQAKGATSGSLELLQQILQQKVDDSAHSIETISQMVSTLQNIIVQVTRGAVGIACEQTAANPVNAADNTTTQNAAISEEDVTLILDFITESGEHLESAEAGLLELENKPGNKDTINQIFRGFHTIKGMAGFLNLTEIGSLAHSAESLLGLAREGKLTLDNAYTNLIFESMDMLKKMIASLKESIETGSPVKSRDGLPQLLEKLKIAADNNPVLQKSDSAKTDTQKPADIEEKQLTTQQDEKIENVLVKEEASADGDSAKRKNLADEKIKVSTGRLDTLINMVGELVIAQLMVSEEVNKNLTLEHQLNSKVAHQCKIVRELQELSLSMRMVPIGGVFQKMTRLVRDLSHKAGKNVNFITSGEETELDRSIVDKISDPLIHMIRNSVDHGIESAEERKQAGKNPVGQIELRAFHRAGNIIIEIQDDGKGLNKELILKKAIEKGLVKPGLELSEDEIFKLIFHAGLSTAQKVTSISGRGVGMDVVKKNVESLNGKIDISSIPGKGTTFTIRLPLTLAIIDGQVVKVGHERYLIPINSIVNSFRPSAQQISTVQNKGEMVLVRGELIPLIRLHKLFGVVPLTLNPAESLLVVVENDEKRYSLLVDELLEQQQVVIKNLGDGLGKVKGMSGGAIMGDGKVSLILDVPGLIELARSQ